MKDPQNNTRIGTKQRNGWIMIDSAKEALIVFRNYAQEHGAVALARAAHADRWRDD